MKKLILFLLIIYQKFVSPRRLPCCRFYPCCSDYAIETFKKYRLLKAFGLVLFRFLRCNPLCKSGYDPVR